ncbi:MAG TPA: septal ring lytic transglycosylase RlpA family protein, partial [Coleofasciculaceae cyanobacterium]
LRRTLGNANPLSEISGMPQPKQQVIAIGPIRLRLNGWASWYGPGFHGNPSASGEPFNQHALTAAHRTLPFGTRVQVTNLDNGRTVVVRINDRGPFHGNRIIDLSTAAARILGLVQSGVAPVRLDVVDDRGGSISIR